MSRTGFTPPSTWVTSPSKHRTTWQTASTLRMWLRNLFPNPSPVLAPFTSPAMSTSRTVAGMTFSVVMWEAMTSSRGSGTGTTPTFGSMVANG